MTYGRYPMRSRSNDDRTGTVYSGGTYRSANFARHHEDDYDYRDYEEDDYHEDDRSWGVDDIEDAPLVGRREARHRERQQQRKDRRRSILAMVVVVTVFLAVVTGGWWGYTKIRDVLSPPDYAGKGSGQVDVQIQQGDSASDVGNTLAKADVVKSARAFADAAADDDRSTSLQPGTYRMRKQMKASLALDRLLDPASRVTRRFTVPEGKSVRQAFAIIENKVGISTKDLEAAAAETSVLGLLPSWARTYDDPIERLEGFLYPATYDLEPKMGAVDVLTMMVTRGNEVLTQLNFEKAARDSGHEPSDVLIVASLLEGEGIPSDFGKISRVVYNRLDTVPAYLNFDSTTQYWLEKNGKGRAKRLTDRELRDPDNNYSTTVNTGLPPTAIANPGKAALEAALNPEPGPWMYFVLVDENGRSAFAETHAEHDANIRICKEKDLGC